MYIFYCSDRKNAGHLTGIKYFLYVKPTPAKALAGVVVLVEAAVTLVLEALAMSQLLYDVHNDGHDNDACVGSDAFVPDARFEQLLKY